MSVGGIVAEYNPFHNGHKFQIDSLKEKGFSQVVVALSGNFVQRGDAAIIDKWSRAKAAIGGGADLVVEIPTCYCLAPAEKYAFGAISSLENLKVVDTLCFGSESADESLIETLALKILRDEKVENRLKEILKSGVSFPFAREKAVEEIYGEKFSKILKNPNDTLGIEYLNAIKKLKSKMDFCVIKRTGVNHDEMSVSGNIASASKTRELILDDENYQKFLPEYSADEIKSAIENKKAPALLKNAQRAVLYSLRNKTQDDFLKIPDISEGLESRIKTAADTACDLDELYSLIKTKRYTLARVKRLVLCAVLGIEKYEMPPYIRVLGFSENGKELLKEIKQKADLPLVSCLSDIKKLGKKAEEYFNKESNYTDFYSMLMPKVEKTGAEFSKSIVKIKN